MLPTADTHMQTFMQQFSLIVICVVFVVVSP